MVTTTSTPEVLLVLQPGDLRPGDVLLFRGTGRHPLSTLIRVVDNSDYDHVAFVALPPSNEPDGRIWVRDVGFSGPRHFPIEDYDDQLDRVLVRRHRHKDAGAFALEKATQLATTTDGYAFDRLLYLVLLSLTRWTDRFAEDPVRARQFAQRIVRLFDAAQTQKSGQIRWICTELTAAAHDGHTPAGAGEPDSYHGLVIHPRPLDGLLAWAASLEQFDEFVTRPRATAERSDGDANLDADEVLHLFRPLFASMPGSVEIDDDVLRQRIVATARITLRLSGRLDPGADLRLDDIGDPGRMAAWLLHEVLSAKPVLGQEDIRASRSLYDVGFLDLVAANAGEGSRRAAIEDQRSAR